MSDHAELYACLYVPEFPAQALLRLRPERRTSAFAVLEGEPPLQTVCSQNAAAQSLGVAHGMTQVELETFPSVATLSRSHAEEAATRSILLDCAGTFSPRVEDLTSSREFVCIIDIAGTEKLLGPPNLLASILLTRIRATGTIARIAVSSNFNAAVSLARGTRQRSITIVACGDEAAALAHLPVSTLDLTSEQSETFNSWGIQTLGELARLPEIALISRMGQSGKRLRQLAQGTLDHHFLSVEAEFSLYEHLNLDSPVEALESLLFVLGVLLEQVILRASAHILALASVTITLTLEGSPAHTRTVRPALPTNNKQLWIKLLHLDLEAHPPSAAILALTLTAEPGTTSKIQLGLFSPQLPEPSRLDVTLARIRAIVGEDNVGHAVIKDTHHPENFRVQPFSVSSAAPSAQSAAGQGRSATRYLRPPETIAVALAGGRPSGFVFRQQRYRVDRAYGPWLAGGEWWNAGLWGHEQWDIVASIAGASLLCCCLVRDLVNQRWQIVALYD